MSPKKASIDLVDLDRRVKVLELSVATVVAELRTRKVIPAAPASKRERKVKMDPETRRAQRVALAAEARAHRWTAKPAVPIDAGQQAPKRRKGRPT